jgi:hypothetical protein
LASRLILDNTDGFNPESETTRGEFIAYIVKGLGIFRTGVAHEAVFTDMTIKDADVLTQAKAYGIVDGYDDGSIRAEDTLTREEAMVMLYNALESMSLLQDSEGLEVHFTDENSVSWWAKESVVRIAELGIVHGTDNRMLNPKETLTYAEALSMVFNMLEETGLIN